MASNPIPDLWPDSVRAGNVHTPLTILKAQAENLNARMHGLLRGEIIPERGADKIDYAFVVHAPTLGRRTVLLHAIRDLAAPYPVVLVDPSGAKPRRPAVSANTPSLVPARRGATALVRGMPLVDDNEFCPDASAFQTALGKILASDATRSVIASLLAEIQDGEPEASNEG